MKAALVAIALLGGAVQAAPNPRLAVGLDEHVGAVIPRALAFTDSTGKHVTLGDYFRPGRPVVLVLAYARCRMLCSVVLRGMTEAVRDNLADLGRAYLPVIVSLDPHESAAEAYARQDKLLGDIGRPGQRALWPYLVGDDATIHALASVLGFRYAWDPQTEQYAHPAVVFVLTPDGRIAEYLRGITYEGLGGAATRAAHGELSRRTTTAEDLLTCFHFDPSLRRYGAKIALLFKLGGAVVLAMLVALIAALVRWERRRRT